MIRVLRALIQQGLEKQVPAVGLGVYRILIGLVILGELLFLVYFRHLIFDRTPFFEPASPVIDLFLALWVGLAVCLTLGYHTRLAAAANYGLWVLFVGFTPMWLDFDGGFDQMMIAAGFMLMFMPTERALSLDNLRLKLRYSKLGSLYQPNKKVSVLAYTLPIAVVLGLLYLDAGIHKLYAEFWRNGMGAWLPPTHPYYMSPLHMGWLLENKRLEQLIGYSLMVFQFLFLPLFWFKRFRIPLLLIGGSFHLGIVLSLNIYQFGFGMLVQYALLMPFSGWRALGALLQRKTPALTVFYDGQCPLCNRTVIILSHFDVFAGVAFKDLQSHARHYPALGQIDEAVLLKDLYALDSHNKLYAGVDAYIRILAAMAYPIALAGLLRMPGIYQLAKRVYRHIADSRARLSCDEACAMPALRPEDNLLAQLWAQYLGTPRRQATRIAKFLVLVMVLQLNSTLQFAVFYRLNSGHAISAPGQLLEGASNAFLFLSHTFLGITPHALYMHDHFVGYNHIIAIAYRDQNGQEQFLPFVNEEGRIVAPNWGRVQCWWANIAVTPRIKRQRFNKALMQATAFWGANIGLDVRHTEFILKMKEVRVPMRWEPHLREDNLRQPWRDIGVARWDDVGHIVVETPGLDLEAL
jgi:predicted DCC family thiol-disulfide oxidoreductase YuxK